MGLGGEDHERGIQTKDNEQVIAQVTFHTDHPFWESFTHDTPAHFDQLAALAKKQTDGSYIVTLDNTKGVDYTAFKGADGNPLPWRACDSTYTPPNSSAQMGFDSLSIPHNPSGDPATSMRDYWDYMRYDQVDAGPPELRRALLRQAQLPVAAIARGAQVQARDAALGPA